MKAISLWQPWATLLVIGEKKIETRHWATEYRGPLLIHAAKRQSEKWMLEAEICRRALARGGYDRWEDLPFGALVGGVSLVDCIPTEGIPLAIAGEAERAFGNYDAGRFAWVMAEFQRFIKPVPWTGRQGFFEVPDAEWALGTGVARQSIATNLSDIPDFSQEPPFAERQRLNAK